MLEHWKLSHALAISICFIVIFIVTGILIINYVVMVESTERDAVTLNNNSEKMIISSFQLIDTGLKIHDNSYNNEMERELHVVMDAYNRSGGDPSGLDLMALKKQINGMGIYFINQSGVITHTTDQSEYLLNLSEIYPDFSVFLRSIIDKPGFYPDHFVEDYLTHETTKYAYMPTPDSRYILELSLAEEKYSGDWFKQKYKDVLDEVMKSNPNITDYLLFTSYKALIDDTRKNITEEEGRIIDKVLSEKRDLIIEDPITHVRKKYLLVNISDPLYPAEMSLIVQLTYDDHLIHEKIQNLLIYHLLVAVIGIFSGVSLSLLISTRLTKPVEQLVEDVNHLAEGDLTHQIQDGRCLELQCLQESIKRLVTHITSLIHDLKNQEQKVQESERRYRSVVETQTEFICRFLPDGTYIFVNDAFCRFFGKRSDEILNTRFVPIIPGSDRDLLSTHYASLTPDHPSAMIDHQVIIKGNEVRWVQWNDQALFDDHGNLQEYQSVGRDITDLKRLEESLSSSKILYRLTIDSMTDGVHVIDRNYVIKVFNKGFSMGFRYLPVTQEDQVVGRNLFEIFPFIPDSSFNEYEEVFQSGVMLVTEEELYFENQKVVTETRKIPITIGNSVEKIVTIIRDITMKKEAEMALHNMNRMLEEEVRKRTQELEATIHELDSFSYSVSHDLRGPLRGIDGFAHILEMKLGEDSNSEISYYLRRVYDNIRLMDALIGDLLKFSRMSRQQITKQIVDLDILVNDIIAEFRSSDSLDTYSFRIDHLPVCNGDPILIRQVFVNLLSNAIKFSRNRQYAIIEIGADHIDAMNVYFIRDNGIGLDMRYADKIFEVFHRLNPSDTFEGTGLGLAIVKRIIIRHGGKIWVNSEEGTGTTFFFTLGVNHE